jgi:hypothetical protein
VGHVTRAQNLDASAAFRTVERGKIDSLAGSFSTISDQARQSLVSENGRSGYLIRKGSEARRNHPRMTDAQHTASHLSR